MAEIIPFPRFHRAQLRALLRSGQAAPGRKVWGPNAAAGEHGQRVKGIATSDTPDHDHG